MTLMHSPLVASERGGPELPQTKTGGMGFPMDELGLPVADVIDRSSIQLDGHTSSRRARILVVDRPGWVYHGCAAVSNRCSELELVGRALDVADALRLAAQTPPDILLVNLPADAKRAVENVQQLHHALPQSRIIAFASQATGGFIRAVTESGASGLLFKDDDSEVLADVIRTVLEGNRYCSPVWMPLFLVAKDETDTFDTRVLTRREWDVIKRIHEGKTSRAIGQELGIELTTVHAHQSNIMKKLNIHKVAGLVRWYELHRKHLQ